MFSYSSRLLFISCLYILLLEVHPAAVEIDKNVISKKGNLVFVHVVCIFKLLLEG